MRDREEISCQIAEYRATTGVQLPASKLRDRGIFLPGKGAAAVSNEEVVPFGNISSPSVAAVKLDFNGHYVGRDQCTAANETLGFPTNA